jgi:hypothetical protein
VAKDEPCEICGGWTDGDEPECICPECDVCGEYGNPECYQRHGLRRSLEQEAQLAQQQEASARQGEAQAVGEFCLWAESKDVIPMPQTIALAIVDAERCLAVLGRAFGAGIKPIYAAKQLVEMAKLIQTETDKWTPPNDPSILAS